MSKYGIKFSIERFSGSGNCYCSICSNRYALHYTDRPYGCDIEVLSDKKRDSDKFKYIYDEDIALSLGDIVYNISRMMSSKRYAMTGLCVDCLNKITKNISDYPMVQSMIESSLEKSKLTRWISDDINKLSSASREMSFDELVEYAKENIYDNVKEMMGYRDGFSELYNEALSNEDLRAEIELALTESVYGKLNLESIGLTRREAIKELNVNSAIFDFVCKKNSIEPVVYKGSKYYTSQIIDRIKELI